MWNFLLIKADEIEKFIKKFVKEFTKNNIMDSERYFILFWDIF